MGIVWPSCSKRYKVFIDNGNLVQHISCTIFYMKNIWAIMVCNSRATGSTSLRTFNTSLNFTAQIGNNSKSYSWYLQETFLIYLHCYNFNAQTFVTTYVVEFGHCSQNFHVDPFCTPVKRDIVRPVGRTGLYRPWGLYICMLQHGHTQLFNCTLDLKRRDFGNYSIL